LWGGGKTRLPEWFQKRFPSRYTARNLFSSKLPKQFGWIHEIACPSENELFVAEVVNWRVQKLILHPEKVRAARD
jgi:hypothetical protein